LQGATAIGDLQPRRFTATVTSSERDDRQIDRRYMEKIQTWDQLSRAENFRYLRRVAEANRWVFRLLQSRALHKLPTATSSACSSSSRKSSCKAGDVVIREGEAADYYYAIKDGAASVTKSLETGSAVVAYLVRGDTFGEDALLANTTRKRHRDDDEGRQADAPGQARVRRSHEAAGVEWLTPGMASIMARQGAVVVDVRMREEFEQRSIKDAVNTPLYTMRETVADSTRRKKYIVYCNTGERSAAAASSSSKLGFEVYALQGGILGA
jgi:rhodanese-related sulfurtransferase